MYSGIIEQIATYLGAVSFKNDQNEYAKFCVASSFNCHKGRFISLNGLCFRVDKIKPAREDSLKYIYISSNVPAFTNSALANLKRNQIVNIESPIVMGQELPGQFFKAHCDDVVTLYQVDQSRDVYNAVTPTLNGGLKIQLELSQKFKQYIYPKAIIAIDGVALQVQEVTTDTQGNGSFTLSLSCQTVQSTAFRSYRAANDDLPLPKSCNFQINEFDRAAGKMVETIVPSIVKEEIAKQLSQKPTSIIEPWEVQALGPKKNHNCVLI